MVARDSRPSGESLHAVVIEYLRRCGCRVIDLDIISTPGAALMVKHHQAAGGIVLTASHNPAEWNGLKFLTREARAPTEHEIRPVLAVRSSKQFKFVPPNEMKSCSADLSAPDRHVAAVLATLSAEARPARSFRVALDSVNGAGGAEARQLLEALGCSVVHLGAAPTGRFTHVPEPLKEHLGELSASVREHQADIGFAQDPDADRLAVVDERGEYIGEEFTLALTARCLFRSTPGAAATNLSTSRMIDDVAKRFGPRCAVFRSAVGEANVVKCMRDHRCVLGGEGNGGVIDPQVVFVRDSLVGMARIVQLLSAEQRPLSQIVADMPSYQMIKYKMPLPPGGMTEIVERCRESFAQARIDTLDGVRIDMSEGWMHLRASNTEPVLRIIVEATTEPDAEALLERARALIVQP